MVGGGERGAPERREQKGRVGFGSREATARLFLDGKVIKYGSFKSRADKKYEEKVKFNCIN